MKKNYVFTIFFIYVILKFFSFLKWKLLFITQYYKTDYFLETLLFQYLLSD